MSMKNIQKLLGLLPDGPKKEALKRKLESNLSKKRQRGGDGLRDSFELTPRGHIKIEEINSAGKVVGVLADQKNLVLNGAEEILLRAFSGDPTRVLYKNRIPKASTGTTNKIYIAESKLKKAPLFDGNQLLHAPNLLWAEVNDDDFEISYGYYPVTLYIKEEVSGELGKKAFTLSKTPAADRVALSAEIYSGYTNMFIGIGEGENYKVPFTDNRLTLSKGITVANEKAKAILEGESIKFKQKISNFVLEVEKSNKGAQIDIFVNDVLKETIETLDSELSSPAVHEFKYDGFDNTSETEIKIVHSGADSGVSNPEMSIVAIRFDALSKNMNGLLKEITNFETEFVTPAAYNTTPMGPFTIQIPNHPIKEGTVKVSYEGTDFTEVKDRNQLNDLAYVVDHMRGIVEFNRALTGVMVTYSITGEIYDSEMVSTMIDDNVSREETKILPVTNEVPSGALNSSNRIFKLSQTQIQDGTLLVKKGGATLSKIDFESIDLTKGTFTLVVAPAYNEKIIVDYSYSKTMTVKIPCNKYKTEYAFNKETVRIIDQSGNLLELVEDVADFGDGKYMFDTADKKCINLSKNSANGTAISYIEINYRSAERPGVPTNYTRAIVEKPKTVNEYPWFELDKGSVRFVAEFPEFKPAHNITIREMGLFDGPRVDDKIAGFREYPVKAFSLVRVGDTRKDVNTGIRITWTITLLNEGGKPFMGGKN
ncbi:hypothetical protein [Bacillus thuringiensis]|uniref:hypothetical protein n=1 Tax=Bacillus thuringiensis TaxID=1428 RepID=UPI00366E56EA